ncbi:MAG TPA: PAS domain-containing protein [Polyangiaceae bacterium]
MKASASRGAGLVRDAADILETAATASSDELVRTCRLLATERARYYHLFASGRDACVITDAKGVIRDANQRAGEMLGMSPSALRGKLLIAFVARGDTRSFRQHLTGLAELAGRGSPVRLRMRARGAAPFDATLWVDGGPRASTDEPISYRWTMHPRSQAGVPESALSDVLGAVASLARPAPGNETELGPAGRTSRIGDLVAATIQRMSATAEQRRVRFAVEGGELSDHVRADAQRLELSIDGLLQTALAAAPDGGELRVRLDRDEVDTVLDVHVDGVDAGSIGSPLSLVYLAARLAADGGRLEVGSPGTRPLMRVRWSAAL